MKRLMIVLLLMLSVLVVSPVVIQAQRPDAPEYAQTGSYDVGTMDFTIDDEDRPLDVTIWYPAESGTDAEPVNYMVGPVTLAQGTAQRDADPDLSGAPYPLVIFSHGSGGTRFQSIYLTEHLASHGFVVIAADHPTNTILDELQNNEQFFLDIAANFVHRPNDLLRVLDYADSLAAEGDLAGLIDMARVAVAGHSFGGYTALAVSGARLNFDQLARYCESATENPRQPYAVCPLLSREQEIAAALGDDIPPDGAWPAIADPRIQATVALAPWNGPVLDLSSLSAITTPVLFIVGSTDEVTPPERDAYFVFSNLSQAPRAVAVLENAGHYVFVDQCSDLAAEMGLFNICSDPVWDMTRAHDLINHFTTAFLRSVLYDDGAATAAFQPGAVDFPGVSYAARGMGPTPETLVPEVIAAYPHDSNAFTQGLLIQDGLFYESTGRNGQSTLRQVDPESGEVLRSVSVPDQYFAEGLALVEDRLVQLTWVAESAFVYDFETFEQVDTLTYEGEGWGLCYDGEYLYRTDGSDTIFLHDPETLRAVGEIHVSVQGQQVSQLNELECAGDDIYANVWQTDAIYRIDKASGYVTALIDASGLLTPQETAALGSGGVLNGIAYDADNDQFYLTGKLWPKIFQVNFVAR